MVINEVEVQYSTSIKYLGITLDTGLDFRIHLDNKIKSGKKLLLMINNFIGKLWGPSPRALKYAYESLVVPSLTYGALVWHRVCQNPSAIGKLRKLNRLAMCSMIPLRKGTPIRGLEIILNLISFHLKVKKWH